LRYWDGTAWTEHVSDNGVATKAPVQPPPPPVAVIPPTPTGTAAAPTAAAAQTSGKPWYKRPVPLIVLGAVVIGVIGATANSLGVGGTGGGSTTFPVSNLAAAELETHSFFTRAGDSLGSFDVINGIPGCDADVALGLIQGADTDWPAAIKVPYEKVIADIQREQAACAAQDQAAFIAANDDAAADLAAAGRAWDAMHCKVDDVFAESPTATCR
jgi:hypothetical protein